jgi:glycosyltransferase involved in cell wall biosynthesis
MDNVIIVIPAYNEEENIPETIEGWYEVVRQVGNGSKLFVVDDGSKDGTYAQMLRMKKEKPDFIPFTKKNGGHGAVCLFGYGEAIEKNPSFIFQTDSDGQTDPAEFWKFWEKRKQYDLIIGSRKKREDGFGRVVVSKTLKLFIFASMGTWIEDANTPFRLMRTSVLRRRMKDIPRDFFLSNVLMSVLFVLYGDRCLWLPISFKDRSKGVNFINFRRIFKIGLHAIKEFRNVRRALQKRRR